ncbi:MAG: RagB/SusD family nutrient uptake outer membrane protein [Muribaculaceae bacterium]|nr:RagB/SusD family nutrient uptake outer membrane protein [Muribaculaceae bacterium]
MKLKYILAAFIAGAAMLFSSCEDGLDIPKHGNMGGQDDFYKTDAEAEQAVASLLTSWGGNYYNWYYVKNLLSDDAWTGGGSRGDNADMERLNEYTFDTDHGMIAGLYSGLYSIIYKANLIIEKVTPDTPVKAQAVAEAYFFRGWAHFELASMWGTAPVVDHLLQPDEYHQSNSTPEELWARTENDFRTAIESNALPTKSSATDATGGIRVTTEVAHAMLGKTLLFEGKYAEAASELDKVIDSKKYELYQGEYDMLHHAATNGCCEAMLEVQKRNDPEQAWAQMTMVYIMNGWRTSLINLGSMSEIASGTYGFLNPSEALYDAFVAGEGKNGYRLKSTIRTYDELNAEYGLTVNAGERLVGHEGLFNWKNRALKEDCVMDASYFQALQYTNLRVMRYAEVLLLAAEAHVMSGGTRADEYVNAIRSRARLQPVSGVTLEDIKEEKRLELCLECVRFQDIVRWKEGEKYLGEKGACVPAFSSSGVEPKAFTNATYGFKAKHNLLPIPRKEMELNRNMTQNTGW